MSPGPNDARGEPAASQPTQARSRVALSLGLIIAFTALVLLGWLSWLEAPLRLARLDPPGQASSRALDGSIRVAIWGRVSFGHAFIDIGQHRIVVTELDTILDDSHVFGMHSFFQTWHDITERLPATNKSGGAFESMGYSSRGLKLEFKRYTANGEPERSTLLVGRVEAPLLYELRGARVSGPGVDLKLGEGPGRLLLLNAKGAVIVDTPLVPPAAAQSPQRAQTGKQTGQ